MLFRAESAAAHPPPAIAAVALVGPFEEKEGPLVEERRTVGGDHVSGWPDDGPAAHEVQGVEQPLGRRAGPVGPPRAYHLLGPGGGSL